MGCLGPLYTWDPNLAYVKEGTLSCFEPKGGKRTQMQSYCNFINKRGYSEITTTKILESKTKTYFNRDTEGITGTGLTINGPTNNTQGTWTIYRHRR